MDGLAVSELREEVAFERPRLEEQATKTVGTT
jgi:hypothetical protein